MQAGAAQVVINPPLPVQLAGYGCERVCTEIGDDLVARALVVEADGRLVALLSAELLWLERRNVLALREKVAARCPLAGDDLLVACIHTHNGPDTLDWFDFAPVNPAWLDTLLEQLASAVYLAWRRLRPVRAELVRGTLDLGINRRERTPDGIRIGEWPEGPVDRSLTGLRLLGDDGELVAAVVCGAVHPVCCGSAETRLSGDWPGLMCRGVEQQLGGVCLFVNGASADVNPLMWKLRGWETKQRLGRRATGAALELLARDTVATGERVACVRTDLTLPHKPHPYLGIPFDRRLAADGALVTEVQALRLGPLVLVSQPGECLVETGALILARAAVDGAVIAGYSNDYVGYLPLPHIYAEGGYEPNSTMLPAESVLTLVDTAVELAQQVGGA